jgi:hypothetical protein
MSSEPYDPYIGKNQAGGGASNSKTAAIQQQIDDTVLSFMTWLMKVGIMRDNITKVSDRDARLNELGTQTGIFKPIKVT